MLFHMLHSLINYIASFFSGRKEQERKNSNICSSDIEPATDCSKTPKDDSNRLRMAIEERRSISTFLSRESLPLLLQLATPEIGDEMNVNEIVRLIKEENGFVNCFDEKGRDTLLHRLAENIDEKNEDQSKLLEFLIDSGANVNALNINLETPLHLAVKNNKYHTVDYLMMRRADANQRNNVNNTCLHLAVEMGNVECVAVLHIYAEQYLDESIKNKHNFSALELAKRVEFNDNRLEMEKICEILTTDPDYYRATMAHKKYLKRTDEDAIWCLRPSISFNNVVYGNGTLYAGVQNFYAKDSNAIPELLSNAEMHPLTGEKYPAIMFCKDENKNAAS